MSSWCVPALGLAAAAALAAWPAPAQGGGYVQNKPVPDPASGRLVYTQTAFSQPAGSFDFYAVDAYQFFFSWGITKNFSLSVTTIPPIHMWGLGIFPKLTFRLAPRVRLGFVINAGFFYPFYLEESEEDDDYDHVRHAMLFLFGGAPLILTFGDESMFFNLSLHMGEIADVWWGREDGERFSNADRYSYFFPSFGGGFRVSAHVKFNFQIWTVLSVGEDFNGRLWGITPAFRFHGRHFYIDAVLLILLVPFLDYHEGELMGVEQLPPLFAPMVIFGVRT